MLRIHYLHDFGSAEVWFILSCCVLSEAGIPTLFWRKKLVFCSTFLISQLCFRTFAWMAGQVAAHSMAGAGLRGQWLPCQCTHAGAGGHLAAGPNHAPWLDPSDSTSSVLFPLPKQRTCRNVLSLTSSSICQVWIKLLSCSKREEEREMYEWTDCVII